MQKALGSAIAFATLSLGFSSAFSATLDDAPVCPLPDKGGPTIIQSSITRAPYPPAAIRLGLQGIAILEILIDESGIVRDARVVQSSGEPVLDTASVQWALTFAYRPASVADKRFACTKLMKMPWELMPGSLAATPPDIFIKKMGPDKYPAGAKERREHGTTIITATIDDQGRVIRASTIQSSGSKELDDAALQDASADDSFAKVIFLAQRLQLKKPSSSVTLKYEWSLDQTPAQNQPPPK